jgi:hypothetical protein
MLTHSVVSPFPPNEDLWLADIPIAVPDLSRRMHTNVAHELYNSEQNARDHAALATRFSIPTVINGQVYIGTRSEVDVYRLLSK